MKKILLSLVFIFICSQLSISSPLIYKTTKAIKDSDSVIVDTSKYSKVRIRVTIPAKEIYTEADGFQVKIYDIEGSSEEVRINQKLTVDFNTILELPASKTKIEIKGDNRFTIYVWGE